MTFSAKKTLADLDLKPFPFEDLAGIAYELPHLKSLNTKQAEAALSGDMSGELAALIGPETTAAIDAMPVGVQQELAKAWLAHSEAVPGELVDSSPSSVSTASPSKPTSRAGTGSKTRKR